jgi:hypothetical protein
MRALRPVSLALFLISVVACNPAAPEADEGTSDDVCVDGKCDSYGGKTWLIDMRGTKVASEYGVTGRYFWGMVLGEDLKELGGVAAAIEAMGLDDLATAQFAAFGASRATFKVVWDQLQNVQPGYPTLFFASYAEAKKGIAAIKTKTKVSYQIVVISAEGEFVAAPGKLNVVPLLKETAPAEQKHLRKVMRDGDVISYVHPESLGFKQAMERRSSHVAMHYTLTLDDGRELVHHIDNPNGYGPEYNHKPSRHMPFHAFRYAPKGTATAAVTAYGRAARNWAFITNDLSPFAGFFDLRLQKLEDLDSFVTPALKGEPIPNLYCSGLAYTNLNLGLNRPLTVAGLGAAHAQFLARDGWEFSDAERKLTPAFLGEGLAAAVPLGKLVFPPYDATDILDQWMANTFKGVPAVLGEVFPIETIQALPDGEGKQKMLALHAAGQAGKPEGQLRAGVIKQVIAQPQFHDAVANGFRQLEWSDADGSSGSRMPVATVENARMWTLAFGLPAAAKDVFLANPCTFAPKGGTCVNKVTDSEGKSMELMAAVMKAGLDPSTLSTPMDVVKALGLKTIKNRFVPPRIWLDQAEGSSAPMRYLGTVINCELLSSVDGKVEDACAFLGKGSGAESYKEGAADTHTYPHFGVRAGGQITHRRIDGSRGPELFGHGTTVTARVTASEVAKVRFLVHVPATWNAPENDPVVAQTLDLAVWDFNEVCTARQLQKNPAGTCAPKRAILLRPALAGKVLNRELKFDLVKDAACTISGEELECDALDQGVDASGKLVLKGKDGCDYDGSDACTPLRATFSRRVRGGSVTHSYFDVTMLNLGAAAGATECELRRELADAAGEVGCMAEPGAAHFDVWQLAIWNRAAP